MAESSKWL